MRIAELNELDPEAALNALGAVFEHSAWAARLLVQERPFVNGDALREALRRVLGRLPPERRLELIAAHPELGNRTTQLTNESRREQAAAGVDALETREHERLAVLNAAYRERFGFPFVICAREHTKESIASALTARLMNDRDTEIEIAIDEIGKIASLRLTGIVTDA